MRSSILLLIPLKMEETIPQAMPYHHLLTGWKTTIIAKTVSSKQKKLTKMRSASFFIEKANGGSLSLLDYE